MCSLKFQYTLSHTPTKISVNLSQSRLVRIFHFSVNY